MRYAETETAAIQQNSDAEMIQSYDARVHWSQVLDRVGDGHRYIVSKNHRAVAALVPVQEWHDLHANGEGDSQEARELTALVERLNAQNEETAAALDDAFAEIAKTLESLAARRAQRERPEQ